ncbi:MAG: cellulase family glycosylhydrolase [Bellilinea sp.]|jgi:hypothetical protein
MIRIDAPYFKDEYGRTLILRGVNLSGSSKVPFKPDGATYRKEGFYDHRSVSFVGRPFPLSEADQHFRRLREWGLTFVRFLVTWEAIEHAGAGEYDQEYLDYIRAVLRKADEYGIQVFIDPHQDVWSRFSGGDGAPGWTLEAVGFDLPNLGETGAAIVHALHGDPFPQMVWPSNSSKLAAATMFTLFFAGNDFAPQLEVEGEPAQEYLQRHYIAAMCALAERVCDLPNVTGYDTLNEPLHGYIGWRQLDRREGTLQTGLTPTPFQSMLLGAGYPQWVDVMERGLLGIRRTGRRLVNPAGGSAWRRGWDCIWRQHGLWDVDSQGKPVLLAGDYFSHINGRAVDFANDYLKPFINRYANAIRQIHPDALIFMEGEAFHALPCWGEGDASGIVYAPHWYDAYVLFFKSYSPWVAVDVRGGGRVVIGKNRIRRSFAEQIAMFRQQSRDCLGNAPVLVGEFGIAFDLNKKHAFRSGDYRPQIEALDRSLRAMDDNGMSFTLWNYTPDNNNERGDLWNDEDLSIFSRDQQTNPADIHSGGRALQALLRPYPMKIAGEPLAMQFDYRSGVYRFRFRHDPQVNAPTELYLPAYQYPRGCQVSVSDGEAQVDLDGQRLIYRHSSAQAEHEIIIRRADNREAAAG